MIIWSTLLALLTSVLIFLTNVTLLITIATNRRFHTTSGILSCNLWMANCIVGVIGIFHNLFFNMNNINPLLFSRSSEAELNKSSENFIVPPTPNFFSIIAAAARQQQRSSFLNYAHSNVNLPPLATKSLSSIDVAALPTPPSPLLTGLIESFFATQKFPQIDDENVEYIIVFGPQTTAALFNSTVSLLALFAMAFMQLFSHHQPWMPRYRVIKTFLTYLKIFSSIPLRLSACIWSVITFIIAINVILVQLTHSFALVIAFQLALVSIFLMFNLVLHPLNLFRPQVFQFSKPN